MLVSGRGLPEKVDMFCLACSPSSDCERASSPKPVLQRHSLTHSLSPYLTPFVPICHSGAWSPTWSLEPSLEPGAQPAASPLIHSHNLSNRDFQKGGVPTTPPSVPHQQPFSIMIMMQTHLIMDSSSDTPCQYCSTSIAAVTRRTQNTLLVDQSSHTFTSRLSSHSFTTACQHLPVTAVTLIDHTDANTQQL